MIPKRWAQYYLGNGPSLVWLLLANVVGVLVGVRYYVETMPAVSTFAWPLYADSPTAVLLAALSITTLLPNLGRRIDDAPMNRPLAYLHTLAFVWLVKYGLWTVLVLNLEFSSYYPDLWAYFGIIITHLLFVVEALLIPQYGETTRGALVVSFVALLCNDFVDYWLADVGVCALGQPLSRCDLYPPLRAEPGVVIPLLTVVLSVCSVVVASRLFERFEPGE
ncbi:DUF1405 domain-containing protein [Halocatena pleomorpha]|uniref:DUF1405 domain-containing protein n=1 Tax=Halocatena pleomorpha TaxID=1785090 RepID=A0A3P3RJL3_9EURY|nr:DUF1405 domain-containing protein [Halocatena pleomorpha]RRJ33726.1 DUF1405 domain-containing protein [Halocatena pleomorpha]